MRLRKNMKRTAAAALALSMAVSTAAVPASAGYTIDMSDAKITGDVEIKQEADGSGTKITISVDGHDKTTDFSDGKEDDKITITGDNTKSAATTTAAADAAKDDTKAPETTVTENKDGTVIDYTGKLDAQPDQEVSRPDSQNDPEADQKNQRAHAAQPDHEHVGVAQQLQFFAAEQQFGSFQPVMRMRFHLSLSFVALRPARSFVLAACEYSFVII